MIIALMIDGKIVFLDLVEFNLYIHDIIYFTIIPNNVLFTQVKDLIGILKETIEKHTIGKLDESIRVAGWYWNYSYVSELDRHIDEILANKLVGDSDEML